MVFYTKQKDMIETTENVCEKIKEIISMFNIEGEFEDKIEQYSEFIEHGMIC